QGLAHNSNRGIAAADVGRTGRHQRGAVGIVIHFHDRPTVIGPPLQVNEAGEGTGGVDLAVVGVGDVPFGHAGGVVAGIVEVYAHATYGRHLRLHMVNVQRGVGETGGGEVDP